MSPTSFRLLGWKTSGFRCPDHEISLVKENDKPYPVSLIQMPNGTGKTTTLNLLRAALSGEADKWDAKKILEFRKQEGPSEVGVFELRLMHDKRLTIQMTFDFRNGTAYYATTVPSGQRKGFLPPPALKRFLRPGFVNFFVFDGELAEHLLSSKHDDAESVIQDLFQLRYFSHLETRVQDYYQQQVAGRTAQEERGLARRRNRVDFLRERIRQLEVDRKRYQADHSKVQATLKAKKQNFDAAVESRHKEQELLSSAQTALTDAKNQVKSLSLDALEIMRDPHALCATFAEEMLTLKHSFDRVKLPESAAREFFEELAEEKFCVCGEELTDKSRKAIRARARQYLGSEEVTLLNAMKHEVAERIGTNHLIHEEQLSAKLEALVEATRAEDEARTHLDSVRDDIVGLSPELKGAQEEISAQEKRAHQLEALLAKFDDPNDSLVDMETYGIEVLKRRFKDADRALSEITQTIEIRSKREVLSRILQNAQRQARERLSEELRNEANERIKQLMPNNKIRISAINSSLELDGQAGASVGETLSVAYAFLSTLFNRAEHVLPFVVDSPANPIDLAVRRGVAEVIPLLTEQFVAFTISSERSAFLEPLERTTKQIQYETLFRKGPKELEQAGRRAKSFVETDDGMLVHGRNFFHTFHLEKEND